MERKRSIGVTIFGVLILLLGLFIAANLLKMAFESEFSGGEIAFYFVEVLLLVSLAIGILRLKNWARLLCLWLSWIAGISIIFLGLTFGTAFSSEPDKMVALKIVFLAAAICVPIIMFFTRPAVKGQFQKEGDSEEEKV